MLVGVSGEARFVKFRKPPSQTEKLFLTCICKCEKLILKITRSAETDLINSSGL